MVWKLKQNISSGYCTVGQYKDHWTKFDEHSSVLSYIFHLGNVSWFSAVEQLIGLINQLIFAALVITLM
jgi:hypothetical protein